MGIRCELSTLLFCTPFYLAQPLGDPWRKQAPRFRILGLQQIAIGGLDKAGLSALWQTQFQLPKVGEFQSEKENVDEVRGYLVSNERIGPGWRVRT